MSIEERYTSKEHYLDLLNWAANELIEQGYLLEEDLDSMLQMGAQHYDLLSVGIEEPQPAGD